MALRWGIISTGKISNEFTKAVLNLPSEEHVIIAVAAKEISRANEFATTYSIPKAYGDYKQLAADSEVDVVYIGTVNSQHLPVAKLMLENGKHVLCEKPLTLNEKQTKKLIDLAQREKRFLMEAIWSRCFPAYEELRKLIDNGEIGEVFAVNVSFGKPLSHIERLNAKELGGGTILDLGVYALQFQQFVFKHLTPSKLIATGCLNKSGTDESASAIITYEGGKSATLCTHSVVHYPNEAIISGTRGFIRVPLFWHPTSLITPSGEKTFPLPKTKYAPEYSGLAYEVEEVGRCIRSGLLESPKVTHAESLQLAKLMDNWRNEVGVVYREDD